VTAIQALAVHRKAVEISSTIAAAVEEQGTRRRKSPARAAGRPGTQQVSVNITDVQRGASETGSGLVASAGRRRSRYPATGTPQLEVGKFLNSVRAA